MLKNTIKHLLRKNKIRTGVFTAALPGAYLIILASGLFDYEWYKGQQARTDSALRSKYSALLHYLAYGRKRGFTPSPFFIPEYFAPGNWSSAIIDPLAQYIVFRRTWSRPTSTLFNGHSDISSKMWPPLRAFVKTLNGDTLVPLDVETKSNIIWASLSERIKIAADQRREQEVLRATSSPVGHFDKSMEQALIARHEDNNESGGENTAVSIVMPAWNREALIGEAIASVQAQTFPRWEMIIVDDGSTDQTKDIIREVQKRDSRVRLIERDHGGVCKARNAALEAAKGEWVAFLDSDNTWTPDFLQTMLGELKRSGKDAGYSAIRMERNQGTLYRTTAPNPELLKTGNYIDLNALVVKKSIVDQTGPFDERLRRMVDYDLICRINKVTEFIYVPIVGVGYVDHDDAVRITTTELTSWDGVVKSNNFIEWNDAEKRVKDKISVLVPVKDDLRTSVRCIRSILEHTDVDNSDIEVIILDSASSSGTNTALSAFAELSPNIKYVRQPASHDNTLGMNYAYEQSSGENVVLVDQRVVVEKGWLDELIRTQTEVPGAIMAPLLIKANRTILSAGVLLSEGSPVNLLENHPLSDAIGLGVSCEVPAAMSGCVMLSAELFRKLKGVNPLYDKGFEISDLCLRAAETGATTVIATRSIVTNLHPDKGWGSVSQKTFFDDWSGGSTLEQYDRQLWSKAGFELVRYVEPSESSPTSKKTPKLERTEKTGRRWAIKIAAPPDERRFAWGDMYFGQAMADALNRAGHDAFIDFLGAHDRPTSYLDDIVLNIRGLANYTPDPAKMNIIWVISHPDDVSAGELDAYDIAYAAGKVWSETISDQTKKPVVYLPQCTDSKVFHPVEPDDSYDDSTLFVGNSRGFLRPIVSDFIEAGYEPSIYGGGWNGLVKPELIKGTYIPNSALATAYGSAKLVLNDHWDDMRRWGFVSNRIFDVAATGGRVMTDRIEGIDDTLAASVVSYENVDELVALKKNGIESAFGSRDERLKVAEYISRNHTFGARAAMMIQDVEALSSSD